MMRTLTTASLVSMALLGGCDLSADFLYSGEIEGVDDVLVIDGPDGRYHVPAVINSYSDIADNAIFAELAPSLTAELGGATFEFVGTGGPICVWVDPEVAFWNQAIGASTADNRQYQYPDNVFDDGDIDITGGLSVFYTGTPDERMGDFVVYYEDSLGNEVPVSLVECLPAEGSIAGSSFYHSGRGAAEFCDIPASRAGSAYTIALQAWSNPLDDDRLSFGVLLAEGSCGDLLELTRTALIPPPASPSDVGALDDAVIECVITGESLRPEDPGPHYGRPDGQVWEGSIDFEHAFCGTEEFGRLDQFCADEALAKADAEITCDLRAVADPDARCFCGDPQDTPDPGNF